MGLALPTSSIDVNAHTISVGNFIKDVGRFRSEATWVNA